MKPRTKIIDGIRVYDRHWTRDGGSLIWEFRAQDNTGRWYGRIESGNHLADTDLGLFVAPITETNVAMNRAVDWDNGHWFDVNGHELRPHRDTRPSISEFLRSQEFWTKLEASYRRQLKRGNAR